MNSLSRIALLFLAFLSFLFALRLKADLKGGQILTSLLNVKGGFKKFITYVDDLDFRGAAGWLLSLYGSHFIN